MSVQVRCRDGIHTGVDTSRLPICLDCGHDIYVSDADYEASLDAELAKEGTIRWADPKPRCKDNLHVGPVGTHSQDCRACGWNIYMGDAEYEAEYEALVKKCTDKRDFNARIFGKEKQLQECRGDKS